jgi:hypothetical protein
MMLTVSAWLLVLLFSMLSGLHFYWALGGRWAIDVVVPVNSKGEKVLKASSIASLVVGVILGVFAMYYLTCVVDWITLPLIMHQIIGWLIPIIFLLRAIGDFNYVGFTKKIKNTAFAKLDTTYFSGLCLAIAVLGIIVQLQYV